jgi:hypothetical protein
MKRAFKTFEEFIGDETVASLKRRAEELQQKDHTVISSSPEGIMGSSIPGGDNDDSGDEMGADVG